MGFLHLAKRPVHVSEREHHVASLAPLLSLGQPPSEGHDDKVEAIVAPAAKVAPISIRRRCLNRRPVAAAEKCPPSLPGFAELRQIGDSW